MRNVVHKRSTVVHLPVESNVHYPWCKREALKTGVNLGQRLAQYEWTNSMWIHCPICRKESNK